MLNYKSFIFLPWKIIIFFAFFLLRLFYIQQDCITMHSTLTYYLTDIHLNQAHEEMQNFMQSNCLSTFIYERKSYKFPKHVHIITLCVNALTFLCFSKNTRYRIDQIPVMLVVLHYIENFTYFLRVDNNEMETIWTKNVPWKIFLNSYEKHSNKKERRA